MSGTIGQTTIACSWSFVALAARVLRFSPYHSKGVVKRRIASSALLSLFVSFLLARAHGPSTMKTLNIHMIYREPNSLYRLCIFPLTAASILIYQLTQIP